MSRIPDDRLEACPTGKSREDRHLACQDGHLACQDGHLACRIGFEPLGMSYRRDPRTFTTVFEDGVEYTLSECMVLAAGGASDQDHRAVHLVKKAFDGVLLSTGRIPAWKPVSPRKEITPPKKDKLFDGALRHVTSHRQAGGRHDRQGQASCLSDACLPACRCGNKKRPRFYVTNVGPHMGVYCRVCERWQGWMSKSLALRLTRTTGSRRHLDYEFRGPKIEAEQTNLFRPVCTSRSE